MLLLFVHPVLVIVVGLLAFLAAIFGALVAPSLWDGDTIAQAVAKTIVILKEHAVVAVLYLLAMGLVSAIILGIIAAVIFPGYFSMTGLAAGIVGTNLVGGVAALLDRSARSALYVLNRRREWSYACGDVPPPQWAGSFVGYCYGAGGRGRCRQSRQPTRSSKNSREKSRPQ